MRCPTCAAFVDDGATACTSCGSEVSVEPPPLPPELAGAPEETPPSSPSPSAGFSHTPAPVATGAAACDSCGNTFPVMELQRVHAQRMCAPCAERAAEPQRRPSSTRMPQPSAVAPKAVSRAPLVMMAVAVVILGGVAFYFTVLGHQGASSTDPGANPGTTPVTTSAPTPKPAPGPAIKLPPPIQKPQDLVFEGELQPWEPEPPRNNPKHLAFVDAVAGRELRLTRVDKFLAGDLKVGHRYRVSYRAIPSDDKLVEIRYRLSDTKIEPVR